MTKEELAENELKFWNFAFEDLNTNLERIPEKKRDDFFKELYCYSADYFEIKNEILKAASYSHNIIIQGVAGGGKTTLVKRYIIDEDFREAGYFPVYVTTFNEDKVIGYITSFIEKILNYIEQIKYPIVFPNELSPRNIIDEDKAKIALNRLLEIIKGIDIPSREMRPIIFFDDLDYAENKWKRITDMLRDFIADCNLTFVFTLRPRLENIILSDTDDRVRYLYHNTEKIIMIVPNILKILLTRMQLIIKSDSPQKYSLSSGRDNIRIKIAEFFSSIGIQSKKTIYESYFNELGISNITEISKDKMYFPFQESYLTFLKNITGSNLRRIFSMAHATIIFLRNNRNIELETNTNGVWKINTDVIEQIFINNRESKWRFLNINKERIKEDISLHYAILHILHNEPENEIKGIKSYKIIQNKLKGITKDKILQALELLSSKEYALIDFIGICEDNNQYRLNKKGFYYLEVSNWPLYKKTYGEHNYIYTRI
jgi:hypothetical protein